MTAAASHDHPPALVDSASLNQELVALCTRFSDDLFAWMDRALVTQATDRRVPTKLAVADVAYALTDRLLYPTYANHPELLPVGLRDAAAN
jgi:hypothetical protein